MPETTYKIVRFYFDDTKEREVIAQGLSLEEAQAHCVDPANSNVNCPLPEAWFDGYFFEHPEDL